MKRALLLSGLLVLAGCGGPDGTRAARAPGGSDRGQPRAISPIATTPADAPTTRAELTRTPMVRLRNTPKLSVHQGTFGKFLALAAPISGGARLLVSDGEAKPTLAPGTGLLPKWAQPRVGTDEFSETVVVYPRCKTVALATCELYEWHPQAAHSYVRDVRHKERPLRKTSHAAGETEGVEVHGNILSVREAAAGRKSPDPESATTLTLERLFEDERVFTRSGGRQADLQGRRLVDLVSEPADTRGGMCPGTVIRFFRLPESPSWDGTAGKPVATHPEPCGLNGQAVVGLALIGTHITWAVTSGSDGPAATAYDYDTDTRKTTSAALHQKVDGWGMLRPRASRGYIVAGHQLIRLDGLQWRPHRNIWTQTK